MNKIIGEKIVKSINSLKNREVVIDHKKTKEGNEYYLVSNKYRLELIINPQKWLGLEFNFLDENEQPLLTHTINTDLYPISEPKYYNFAKEIEDEIVEFLNSLANHKIKTGILKGNTAMIIPKGKRFILNVKKKIFFKKFEIGEEKYYDDINEIEDKGKFYPL